ncbi:cytochrome c oxidase assembly protein [Rhizobium sp. TRM95796]|uniref:cytochrome c oxidase assembly protein n=1 Tax=Rhizobium sp. TRM95796 TaxID=2979862 RepID=UPI0021E6EB8A|nr:cytochrome c oxidase assembly protein [Rhizobium sp. TRM95796]MCV3766395.1 cytochrome c oxidase assembly protein [Rhizobium sp. TRM95796]
MQEESVVRSEAKAAARRNRTVVIACGAFVTAMVGMAYAAVPLYDMFCRVTGYNGTTQRVEQASDRILDQSIRVEFDANSAQTLGWNFVPVDKAVTPKIGETVQINYRVTNTNSETETGKAVFNVTPMVAGAYFNKLECFCFTDITLKPGETRDMPVVFFVDPEIVTTQETKDLKVLTLSYTFYPSDKPKPVAEMTPVKDTAPAKL